MGWYFRKSVKVGLIRFNFSQSGIGASVGVTGFRIGIKPNGKSYIHAGRGGFYYREEFGNKQNQRTDYVNDYQTQISNNNTTYYNTATTHSIKSDYKQDVVEALSNSYNAFRFDYLVGSISIISILLFYFNCFEILNNTIFYILLSLLSILGIISFIYTAKWESKRRSIDLIYEFDGNNSEYYEKIITAFNKLAECRNIWGVVSSEYLPDTYQRKINAGAGRITNRTHASIGSGKLPWVRTNISSIPLLKACGRSLYFMPDGILVYDSRGVVYVDYLDIKTRVSTTRFIEDYPPSDANIVDHTWRYANVNGGPDRRFNNNKEIPICRYGELTIDVKNEQLLYIMTSKEYAAENFEKAMNEFRRYVKIKRKNDVDDIIINKE